MKEAELQSLVEQSTAWNSGTSNRATTPSTSVAKSTQDTSDGVNADGNGLEAVNGNLDESEMMEADDSAAGELHAKNYLILHVHVYEERFNLHENVHTLI